MMKLILEDGTLNIPDYTVQHNPEYSVQWIPE